MVAVDAYLYYLGDSGLQVLGKKVSYLALENPTTDVHSQLRAV